MLIKSKKGLSVPDPDRGDLLPDDQYRDVENNQYWQRRQQDGDIEIFEQNTGGK